MTAMQMISFFFSFVFLAELGWICFYLWRNDRTARSAVQAQTAANAEAILNATASAQNATEAARLAAATVQQGMEYGHKTSDAIQGIAKILAEHEVKKATGQL